MSVNPSTQLPGRPRARPARVVRLRAGVRRARSPTGSSPPPAPGVTAYAPATGKPLAVHPAVERDDVEEAFARARRAQQAWQRTSIDDRAAMLLRLHDLVLDRQDEIIDLICWESGKARKHAFDEPIHVALTARYYARTAHEHLDTERRLGVIPGLTRVEVNHVPEGRRRDHLAVELPVHDGAVRRAPGAARRQRRGHQAGRPDDADRAPRRRSCSRRRASRATCGTSSPAPAASSARR